MVTPLPHTLQPVVDWFKDRSFTHPAKSSALLGYTYGESEYPGAGTPISLCILPEEQVERISEAELLTRLEGVKEQEYGFKEIHIDDIEKAHWIWLNRASVKIAMASRRGMGNCVIQCNWGVMNVFIGNSEHDVPILYSLDTNDFLVNREYLKEYFCYMSGHPQGIMGYLTDFNKKTGKDMIMSLRYK